MIKNIQTIQNIESILSFIPKKYVDNLIFNIQSDNEFLEEVRLRVDKYIFIKTSKRKFFLNNSNIEKISQLTMKEIVQKLGGYSLYSFEEELSQGYFTLNGGHRVGFCGRAVVEKGVVKTLQNISSLNIRIAHDIKDCSKKWLDYLFEKDKLCHIFIISPAGCGKTTFLRDIVRQLSYGNVHGKYYTVGIVDERGEIAGMKNGVCQMDLGDCVDVQENCPKSLGMTFMLRSMSPDVIAVDELGKEEDFTSVYELVHSGVNILATVHGYSYDKSVGNDRLNKLFDKLDYGRVVLLSNDTETGVVEKIWDIKGNSIYDRK